MIRLSPPVKASDVSTLVAGQKVLITGTIYTARDQAHMRLVNETQPKFDFEGAIIYYVGPTPTKDGHIIGSCGPTSAYRMDDLAIPLIEKGIKVMIGKGDRGKRFQKAMIKNNAVYLMAIGGTGALLASKVKSRELLMYEDLGTEAVYKLEVEDFPCFVAYDLNGDTIFKGGNDEEL